MKTKKLFLMAAMLLMSVCSFAQNSNTPLKGDVNEDGKVDVADIAAVINIMKNGGGTTDGKLYFYVGTEKPTSLSQATIVNSYPAEQTYTNNSGKKSHIFVLTNSDKTVEFINLATNNPVDQFDVDITTIPGYKIFETAVGTANGGSIIIKITEAPVYYWYVGQTNPSTMSSISPIVTDMTSPGWRLIGTSVPTYSSSNKLFEYVEGGEIVTGTSLAKQYIAIPANSSACPRDGAGNDASTVDMYTKLSNKIISGVEYKIYETVGKSRKLAIDIY